MTYISPAVLSNNLPCDSSGTCMETKNSNCIDYNTMISSSSSPILENTIHWNDMGVQCYQSCKDLSKGIYYLKKAIEEVTSAMEISTTTTTISSSLTIPSSSSSLSASKVKKLYIYQRADYDEGMDVGSEPVMIYNNDNNKDIITATVLFNLGVLYLRSNEDEEATTCFVRALSLVQQQPNGEVTSSCEIACGVSQITILQNIGYLQYRNGQYEASMDTYTHALRILKEHTTHTNYKGMLSISSVLNSLGVLHFHLPKANTKRAMELYTESLSIRQAAMFQQCNTKELATTLNNIGRVYYRDMQYQLALDVYNEVLVMRRTLLGNDHIDVAATAYNTGQTYHKCGDLDKAMTLYEEFLVIAKNHLGSSHRDVGVMLKCMAQVHHQRNEIEQAKQLYRESLAIGRIALGSHHPELASILNKLANLLYEVNDYDAAMEAYKEGLDIERSVYDSDHPNIAVTLANIAQIQKIRGDYYGAIRSHKEAIQIQRKSFGNTHATLSNTLSSLGLIYYQIRKYTKALYAYQEALRIRRDVYGDTHADVASTLKSIGIVLFKMDLHDYALQSFHESLRIRRQLANEKEKGKPTSSPYDYTRDDAAILHNIATIYFEIGDDDQALKYYRETLRIEQKALGNDHEDVIHTIRHISHLHEQRGELDCALRYLKDILNIQTNARLTKKLPLQQKQVAMDMARTFNQIGNIYHKLAQTKDMMAMYTEATRYYRVAGRGENELNIHGSKLYSLSKLYPECAPIA